MDETEKKLIQLRARSVICSQRPRWKRTKGRVSEWRHRLTGSVLELANDGQYLLTRCDGSTSVFESFVEASIEGEKTIDQLNREREKAPKKPKSGRPERGRG